MGDVFVYLSYKPTKTSKRIARVYRSLKAYVPDTHFCVVTFDMESREGTYQSTFNGVTVPHVIYNINSLSKLCYPNRPITEPLSLTAKGYVDLPIILFWLDNQMYNRFWVMEDDVEYTGDFGALISELDKTNGGAGLACTHLRDLPINWDYEHMFSTGQDVWPLTLRKRVCFLPFFYVTGSALSAIHNAYIRGWAGYNEMTWATVLDYAKIPIRDIGGNGPYVTLEDRNRRYIDNSTASFEKRGSFGTLSIRMFPGFQKNILWHPVKTPRNFLRMAIRRAISIYHWWYNSRVSSLSWRI